jgi:hypothetical protein
LQPHYENNDQSAIEFRAATPDFPTIQGYAETGLSAPAMTPTMNRRRRPGSSKDPGRSPNKGSHRPANELKASA